MGIRVQENGTVTTVVVDGEMNIYRAAELKAGLMKALDEADSIEVDLSGVSEFDSAGVQLLLLARREARRNNKKFAMTAASAPVDSIVRLFGLTGLLGGKTGMEA